MMISSNDPLGGSEGLASSATPAPELGVASGVSGMVRRRSETVANAALGAVSPASSLEETVMASVGDVGGARTTSAAMVPGSTSALGAGWTTSVPFWVVSWAKWGRDEAPADAPAPRFTALVGW